MSVLITRANVRAVVPHEFKVYRKKHLTVMARMPGPFVCETRDGNQATCDDGFVAIDEEGFPYPIARSIAEKSYEPASSV